MRGRVCTNRRHTKVPPGQDTSPSPPYLKVSRPRPLELDANHVGRVSPKQQGQLDTQGAVAAAHVDERHGRLLQRLLHCKPLDKLGADFAIGRVTWIDKAVLFRVSVPDDA